MKYYKYEEIEDHPLGGGTTYIESEGGGAIRQITARGSRYFSSNISYPPWGLVLADGRVDYDDLDAVTPITASEFEDVWQAHLWQHHDKWEAVKQAYPVGAPVAGPIRIFYPQGVIIELDNSVLAVADHKACRASAPPAWIPSTGHQVTAVVGGYDEMNQWVVLEAPRVHPERV